MHSFPSRVRKGAGRFLMKRLADLNICVLSFKKNVDFFSNLYTVKKLAIYHKNHFSLGSIFNILRICSNTTRTATNTTRGGSPEVPLEKGQG
jgi:hypothetical protein